MYVYKVVRGGGRTNYYRSVPVDAASPDHKHGEMADAVLAIKCGIDERTVETFRAEDVRLLKKMSNRENQEFNPG